MESDSDGSDEGGEFTNPSQGVQVCIKTRLGIERIGNGERIGWREER
jgi:hypothetical protein